MPRSRLTSTRRAVALLSIAAVTLGVTACRDSGTEPRDVPLPLPGHTLGSRYVLTAVDGDPLPAVYAGSDADPHSVWSDELWLASDSTVVELAEVAQLVGGQWRVSRLTPAMPTRFVIHPDSSVEFDSFLGGGPARGLPTAGLLVLETPSGQEWRFEARAMPPD